MTKQKLDQVGEVIQSSQQSGGLSPHQVNNISAQLTYLPSLVKMLNRLKSLELSPESVVISTVLTIYIKDVEGDLMALAKFIMQDFLSKQQKKDIQCEVYRLTSLINFVDFFHKVNLRKVSLSEADEIKLISLAAVVHYSGWTTDRLSEEKQDEIVDCLSAMNKKYGINGLTDSERIEIVEAMGLPKGHWFKCPNGHFYCIGDCGGAMEEANCPACGARIGGQQHRLRGDNRLASEMDGAQYSAWSELANLANFDREQLEHLQND